MHYQKLIKGLVKEGYTIVSGLAEGIDTTAHQTALEYGGGTIAVIGTPITECYPKTNVFLQAQIAKKGLVISQVPFLRYANQDYQLNRFFFPERNKTMSAISLGTAIVEAGENSGTLIQAREALYQQRKLFILESCFRQDLIWPKKYEKKGAIKVREINDILMALKN